MEYEINVAKNGIHYFKVIVQYGNVKNVYTELKEKFPECELKVVKWEKVGNWVDMDKCNF